MPQQRYLVLIGDLIRSREASDRAGLQESLKQCLHRLNRDATDSLASPYTLTLGDEFQAVRTDTAGLWQELLRIRASIMPERVRFALGIGTLATPINPHQALGMDGPAFHAARAGMDELKGQPREAVIRGLGEADQRWADALLAAVDSMTRKWRVNRLEILDRLLSEQSPATIATALDLSVQAVYRNMRDGDLELIMELLRLLDTLLHPALDPRDPNTGADCHRWPH